jgi:hypothetical protein
MQGSLSPDAYRASALRTAAHERARLLPTHAEHRIFCLLIRAGSSSPLRRPWYDAWRNSGGDDKKIRAKCGDALPRSRWPRR